MSSFVEVLGLHISSFGGILTIAHISPVYLLMKKGPL